jgi:DNA invertase Pin-like site-specific DNA recombinase
MMAGRPRRGGPVPLGPPRAIAYVGLSADELAEGGREGLAEQRAAVTEACRARGLDLAQVVEESGWSAATLARPRLARVLDRLDRGDADALVVSALDRLTWSVRDLAKLVERAREGNWRLVVGDVGMDTTTPAGETVTTVVVKLADLERRRTSQRSREALATKRSQGVRLGRPRALASGTIDRIVRERAAGMSLPKIAEGLNREGVPTAQGGKRWYASTVRAVLAQRNAK